MLEHNYALLDDELAHHGILGMKWGCKTVPECKWFTYRRWTKKE